MRKYDVNVENEENVWGDPIMESCLYIGEGSEIKQLYRSMVKHDKRAYPFWDIPKTIEGHVYGLLIDIGVEYTYIRTITGETFAWLCLNGEV